MPNNINRTSRLITSNNQYDNIKGQTSTIKSKIDLSMFGYSRKDRNSFVLTDAKAIVNQVKLWLMSEPDDLIRENTRGNYRYTLMNVIGQRMDSKSLDEISERLKSEFNSRGYSTDLELLYIDLKPNYYTKVLTVDFVVKDASTNQITSSSLELKE